MKKNLLSLLAIGASCILTACEQASEESVQGPDINAGRLTENIQILASDEFEGRAPATAGEEKTVAFLKDKFVSLGLKPGNGTSYFQEAKLAEITAEPGSDMLIETSAGNIVLKYGPEYMGWTTRLQEKISLENSEMVFVGYGIVAPEYDWNDYEGLDVAGKTVVILVNDPGYATQNPALFTGNAMTYYGRWTYKFEEAARQGAAGAIVIHETLPAAYPWAVVEGSWSGPQFSLESEDGGASRVKVESWIQGTQAAKIFAAAGLDYKALSDQAATRAFKAVDLKAKISISLNNTIKHSVSKNVVGILPGTDRADEYIIHMAHWDHLGKDETLEGDQIYNGASDNATGTAGLIELAAAYSAGERPRRSIMFLAVAAEEQGTLGSEYYAENPLVPHDKTVAAINMDVLNNLGPTHDVTIVGYGSSELDDYVDAAVKAVGRVANPDPSPEKGSYYRSDHFSLAKFGVPAIYFGSGVDHIEKGREWMMAQEEDYDANRYHKVSDEYSPDWDMGGAVADLKLMYNIGLKLANEDSFPNWREGNEFRAKRDAMMQ